MGAADWGIADELGRDNHDTVTAVNEALLKRGLVTWFDSKQLARLGWPDGFVVCVFLSFLFHSLQLCAFLAHRKETCSTR